MALKLRENVAGVIDVTIKIAPNGIETAMPLWQVFRSWPIKIAPNGIETPNKPN